MCIFEFSNISTKYNIIYIKTLYIIFTNGLCYYIISVAYTMIPWMLYLYINEFPVYWFVLGCIYCSCKSSLIPGMLYSWTWS